MIENKYYVVDSHSHIYPEKIAQKAVANTDLFYNSNSCCLGTSEDLIKNMTDSGIDISVVESVATTPAQVNSINKFISLEVEKSSGRFIGLGTLHPDSQNIKEDILQLKELGLKGVKLHPDIQKFKIDDYRCLKIFEICEKENIPVLMHTGDSRYDFSNPNRLIPILNIYTNLTIIGAHFGGYTIWEKASKELCGIKNFFVDCSSSFFALSDEKIIEIIKRYGADKVLFGSDYPMWSPKAELERFLSLPLSESEKELILSKNAKSIYNLP